MAGSAPRLANPRRPSVAPPIDGFAGSGRCERSIGVTWSIAGASLPIGTQLGNRSRDSSLVTAVARTRRYQHSVVIAVLYVLLLTSGVLKLVYPKECHVFTSVRYRGHRQASEPAKAEIDGFKTATDLVAWSKMGDGLRDVPFAGVGCEATGSVRPIGDMPEDGFEAVVVSLKSAAGGAPTPFMASSWRLFGRLARLAVGAEKTAELTTFEAAAVPPPAQLAAQAPQGETGLTKLATVLDQGLDEEAPTLSHTDLTATYLKYSERMGKPPAEDCEPSMDQRTAILHLLKFSAPPYAGFSVFGPHSISMRKRLKLGGIFFAADGSLHKCELFGPSSFADWRKPCKVLATILILLAQVWPEELDAYHEFAKDYAGRYGSNCWPTAYQADVRCRQEKIRIIRRHGVEWWNADQATATRAGFNPGFPWRYVWSDSVLDTSFWLREVQEEGLLLITKSTSQDTVLDGDVLISGIGGSLPLQIGGGHPLSRGRSPRRNPPPPSGPGRKGQDKGGKHGDERVRPHNLGSDSLFTTNRAGRELCQKFRRGECQQAVRGSCPIRHDLVHQGAKCLSQSHGVTHPTTCTAVAKPPQNGRGGGKGLGRGKY